MFYKMIYILLSSIGFLGKSFLFKRLINIYNNSQLHKLIATAFCLLIFQSVLELLSYYAYRTNNQYTYWFLIAYYFCLFSSVSLLPFIALSASNARFPRWLYYGFLCIIGAITFLLLFSRIIIVDSAFIATTQSVTRVAGPYYFIFQFVFLLCILATLIILIKKSTDKNYFVRIRCRNLCLSFIPFFLAGFFVIISMAFGFEVNAVGIFVCTSLIFLAAMVHNIRPDKQPDYTVFLPFSKKNKILVNTLNRLVYMEPDVNRKTLDEQLIDYYLAQPGLTQKDVSKILNVSEATLSRRKNRFINQ